MAKLSFRTTISLSRHRALICLYVWASYCVRNQPVMSMPVASTNLQCSTANKNPCQLYPDLCSAGGGLCVVKAPCEYQCICPPDGHVSRDCTSGTRLEPGLVVDSLVIFPPDLFSDLNSLPKAEALTAPSAQFETGKETTVTTTLSSVSDLNSSPKAEALTAPSAQFETGKETTVTTTLSSVSDLNSSPKAEALTAPSAQFETGKETTVTTTLSSVSDMNSLPKAEAVTALSSPSETEKETTIKTTPSSVTHMNSSPTAEALIAQSAHLEAGKETTLTTTFSSVSDTSSSLKPEALAALHSKSETEKDTGITTASLSVATTNVTTAASNIAMPHPVRSRLHKKEVISTDDISPQEETRFAKSPKTTTVIEDYDISETNNSLSTFS